MVALAFMAVWGGPSLLWCPSMQEAVSRCCCPTADAPDPEGSAISRADCCETKVFEAAPATSADARTPSAPLAVSQVMAVLPPIVSGPADLLACSMRGVTPGRGGLAPPKTAVHRRNCVYLL